MIGRVVHPLDERSAERTRRRIVVAVSVSAFGPYLLPGLRTEQLVVYALFLFLLPRSIRAKSVPESIAVLALLGGVLLTAMAATIATPTVGLETRSPLAGIDNLLGPIATLLIALYCAGVPTEMRYRLIDALAKTLVACMALNCALSLLQATGNVDFVTDYFWPSGIESVGGQAARQGRFGGIFNQPAEAGAAYSAAGLAAIWLWGARTPSPRLLVVSLTILTVGATFVVSKVFFFVGIPALALSMWSVSREESRSRAGRPKVNRTLRAVVISALVSALVLGQFVGRFARLGDLAELARRPLEGLGRLSSGRLGEDGQLSDSAQVVLDRSPFAGFGLGGLNIPYDAWFLETLAMAGLIGTALFAGVFVILIAAHRKRTVAVRHAASVGLMRGVLAIAVGASFGFPVLTANRIGTIMWLLIGLTILAPVEARVRRSSRHLQSSLL